MYDLTGFQRDLLYIIGGQDEPHGLAIIEELEQYTDHQRIFSKMVSLTEIAHYRVPG